MEELAYEIYERQKAIKESQEIIWNEPLLNKITSSIEEMKLIDLDLSNLSFSIKAIQKENEKIKGTKSFIEEKTKELTDLFSQFKICPFCKKPLTENDIDKCLEEI